MISQEIRRKFLQYFKEKGHSVVSSSPTIPFDDPTLLFTNAGMNQFKDAFLGKKKLDYSRAATSQKCIRAGGKHNDLENVGHTSRHLTFFEMLGNFSFGDYFKQEAIDFAWHVATEILAFPEEKIWATVFKEDDEAHAMWEKYLPKSRIARLGEKDNFWAMGDTGPCGPCSELLFDKGAHISSASHPADDTTGERFFEFWNLVFMQYNRSEDGTKVLLPKPSIDTGMGLERAVSLKMGVDNVFATDILRSLIAEVENISSKKYEASNAAAFHVIADHIRSLSFAIADGATPSNEGRGYVLRKILRRAVRYGRQLGFEKPFLGQVFPRLIQLMGEDYPELAKSKDKVEELFYREEEAFLKTLHRGGNLLSSVVDNAMKNGQKTISGEDAFKLKDTYGLPFEEIELIAKDTHLQVDVLRYQELEKEAKERSKAAQKKVSQTYSKTVFEELSKRISSSEFLRDSTSYSGAKVIALLKDGESVQELKENDRGIVIVDKTPFYAEMGGQVGDTGAMMGKGSNFIVEDCKSPYTGIIAHFGEMQEGNLRVGDTLNLQIDIDRRRDIEKNHTATHLLHWALSQVLGDHIKQAGSVVDAERLRFDFHHHKPVTIDEMKQIESLINEKIWDGQLVSIYETPYEEAKNRPDIKQFFGDKYGNTVRVVDIDYSKELCGGTHVKAVSQIGLFKISKESSIAAGVRRIEACTHKKALSEVFAKEKVLQEAATLLSSSDMDIVQKLEKLKEDTKALEQKLKKAKEEKLLSLAKSLTPKGNFIIEESTLPLADLREFIDILSQQHPNTLIAIGAKEEARCQLLVKVPKSLQSTHPAHELVKKVSHLIEGSGGGKPDFAQAGGKQPNGLQDALNALKQLV